ncbi:hypothetical protein C2G38_2227009 [Gigaspora rosea]|uniref:Uncharacterized protein n=1 Tax=Gigaspora rosea TaxID=44941 RepID=A0A397TXG6_9GLOM|nr:hypothetical protein C2G38_2227009 [Gigaspora rosea]
MEPTEPIELDINNPFSHHNTPPSNRSLQFFQNIDIRQFIPQTPLLVQTFIFQPEFIQPQLIVTYLDQKIVEQIPCEEEINLAEENLEEINLVKILEELERIQAKINYQPKNQKKNSRPGRYFLFQLSFSQMTCTKKADSVPSRMARLQNRLINYQEQAQEINPPDVEALQQASRYEQMVLERNRWRAWAANLEDENTVLRRRVGKVERRVEEASELEEENRELEEENREWQKRVEEVYKYIISNDMINADGIIYANEIIIANAVINANEIINADEIEGTGGPNEAERLRTWLFELKFSREIDWGPVIILPDNEKWMEDGFRIRFVKGLGGGFKRWIRLRSFGVVRNRVFRIDGHKDRFVVEEKDFSEIGLCDNSRAWMNLEFMGLSLSERGVDVESDNPFSHHNTPPSNRSLQFFQNIDIRQFIPQTPLLVQTFIFQPEFIQPQLIVTYLDQKIVEQIPCEEEINLAEENLEEINLVKILEELERIQAKINYQPKNQKKKYI